MKKITPMARIIDLFSTESLETCAMLIDAAQQLVKSRQTRNSVKPTRRTRMPETPASEDKVGA